MALNLYSNCSTITTGCFFYNNSNLTSPVSNGKYSDGTDCYTVTGGNGEVTAISSCPPPVTYDVYLADKYECAGCTVAQSNVLVSFVAGSSVSINSWYPDPNDVNYSYKILSTSSGAGYILTTSFGSFGSCAAACGV